MMSDFEKWISDSVNKYESAKTIIHDLEYCTRPWLDPSLGKAKEILQDLFNDLNDKFKELENAHVLAVRALLKYDIGAVEALDMEFDSSIAIIEESWELIKDVSRNPQCCMLALKILQHLPFLIWGETRQLKRAESFLKEAECLYHDYKEKSKTVYPRDIADIFSVKPETKDGWKSLEVAHINILSSFSQLYAFSGQVENSAKFYQMYLSRLKDSEYFSAITWAFKVASSSEFYVKIKDYATARHLLSCASYVLSIFEASSCNTEQIKSEIIYKKCFISRCWVSYFNLFIPDIMHQKFEAKLLPRPPRLRDDPEVLAIEVKAPLSVTMFNEARNVFLFGQGHVNQAKLYHTFQDDPENYIILELSHCTLYELLLWFEKDLGRKSKMHKRRVDILEDLLSKITFRTYPSKWQEVQYMLGKDYYLMGEAKLRLLPTMPSDQKQGAIKKIKSIYFKSIDCFERFLVVLKDRDGAFPAMFADHVIEGALYAHYYLGQLYELISAMDPSHSEKINNSKKCFRFILDYVKKHHHHLCHIENQLPEIEERVTNTK